MVQYFLVDQYDYSKEGFFSVHQHATAQLLHAVLLLHSRFSEGESTFLDSRPALLTTSLVTGLRHSMFGLSARKDDHAHFVCYKGCLVAEVEVETRHTLPTYRFSLLIQE